MCWLSVFTTTTLIIITIIIVIIIIIIIYPLTARVVGAPQIISQPVFSILPCSPLPSGTCRTPDLFIPWCCLPTFSSVCLVLFLLFTVPCKMVLARPERANRGVNESVLWLVSKTCSADSRKHSFGLRAACHWHTFPTLFKNAPCTNAFKNLVDSYTQFSEHFMQFDDCKIITQ